MKTINTYRKIAKQILRKLNEPVTKLMLYKLSHFLDKLEKENHAGPDRAIRRYTCDELVEKFINEVGPEGIQTKFFINF